MLHQMRGQPDATGRTHRPDRVVATFTDRPGRTPDVRVVVRHPARRVVQDPGCLGARLGQALEQIGERVEALPQTGQSAGQ